MVVFLMSISRFQQAGPRMVLKGALEQGFQRHDEAFAAQPQGFVLIQVAAHRRGGGEQQSQWQRYKKRGTHGWPLVVLVVLQHFAGLGVELDVPLHTFVVAQFKLVDVAAVLFFQLGFLDGGAGVLG